ncbi:MAG TPA: calcium-binding protein [Rhizobiaceae bacterium]|nr:calcium-binding protein [Rhizobiaceae bacterium]
MTTITIHTRSGSDISSFIESVVQNDPAPDFVNLTIAYNADGYNSVVFLQDQDGYVDNLSLNTSPAGNDLHQIASFAGFTMEAISMMIALETSALEFLYWLGDINFTGNIGPDRITLVGGDDELHMGAGNDIVFAGGGHDEVHLDAGNDEAHGGVGNDLLEGWSGNDRLYGDNGNDIFYGNTGNDILEGGIGDDVLFGQENNDRLTGGPGQDKLYGGAGIDKFIFSSPVTLANRDFIYDFNRVDDTIQLDNAVFTKIGALGALKSTAFKLSTQALDADDRIIYNRTTGQIFYDADGSGAGGAINFATLTTKPLITYADFQVI